MEKFTQYVFHFFPLSGEVSIKFQQIQMISFWHENPTFLNVDTSLIALQKSVWNFSLKWDLILYDSLIRGFASQGKWKRSVYFHGVNFHHFENW